MSVGDRDATRTQGFLLLDGEDRVLFFKDKVILQSSVGKVTLEGNDAVFFLQLMVPYLDGTRSQQDIEDLVPDNLRVLVPDLVDLLRRLGLLTIVREHEGRANLVEAWRWQRHDRFFSLWSENGETLKSRLRQAAVVVVGLEPWGAVAASELALAGVGSLLLIDDSPSRTSDVVCLPGWYDRLGDRRRVETIAESVSRLAPGAVVTHATTISPDSLTSALRDRAEPWDLAVVALPWDDVARNVLVSAAALEASVPALFGSVHGLEAIIGPAVLPGTTPCWNCCRSRLISNCPSPFPDVQGTDTSNLGQQSRGFADEVTLPLTAHVVGQFLALEAIKLLTRYVPSELSRGVLVHNAVTLETSHHPVIPMPWCEVCGGAEAIPPSPSSWEALTEAKDLDELRDALASWIDPRTGPVSRVILRTSSASESHLPFRAWSILSFSPDLDAHLPAVNGAGGKGLTITGAMMTAFGEALELYGATRFRIADLNRCPMSELDGDYLNPRDLCLYDDSQYDRREFPFERYDPERDHLWVRGTWLDTGEPVWVPALPTYFELPRGSDDRYLQVTTSGLAAGSSMDEASRHALYELVERDAVMLSWMTRRGGRPLTGLQRLHPRIQHLLAELRDLGAEVELYCLEVGTDLPAVLCVAWGDGRNWPGMTWSSAAHSSLKVAAEKAVLEQGFSGTFLRGLLRKGDYTVPDAQEHVKTVLDHALFYFPRSRAAESAFLHTESRLTQSLEDADVDARSDEPIHACASRLRRKGMRVAIVDLTPPDLKTGPFRVVRALASHLQPLHFGFGLERRESARLREFLTGPANWSPHPLC